MFGDDRKRNGDVGDVQLLALPERARILHGAEDIGAVNFVDGKFDQAIVKQDGGAGLDVFVQTREGLVDARGSARHVFFGKDELLAGVEFHGAFVLKKAGADAGALRVEDDADGKVELFAHLLQVIDMGAMLFVRSVREIEARKIHACHDHGMNGGFRFGGWTERANDLRTLVHNAPFSRIRELRTTQSIKQAQPCTLIEHIFVN